MLQVPTSSLIDAEMALQLNDRFFSSDPLAYFQSRIDSLIAWSAGDPVDFETGLGSELLAILQQSRERTGQITPEERELQVASDAFSVRHHIAESLVRLFVALINTSTTPDPTTCLWAEIAGDRSDGAALVNKIEEFFTSGRSEAEFAPLILPASVVMDLNKHGVGPQALQMLAAWLGHAATLLVQQDLDINAANNKSKHGHAIRPGNDSRWALSTVPPDEDGNLPISALTGDSALPVIDTPVIESLTVPRPGKRNKEGIELSWIRIHTPTVLAEATLMSVVHGALFHVAAARHFADRTDEQPPPYPVLPLGPTPSTLLKRTLTGIRWPVTLPSDRNFAARKSAFVFKEFTLPFQTGEARTAQVVDG